MKEEPIQRKLNAYPKDFTPSTSVRAARTETKNSQQEEFSFSNRRINGRNINYSTQLNDDAKEPVLHNILTINPQEIQKRHSSLAEREKPLLNTHINKRMPYINPDLLTKARIEEDQDKELHCIGQTDIQSSITPGSIRKNQVNQQTPLNEQAPANIEPHDRQATSNRKVNDTQNIFQNSLRSQYINFTNNKAQKLANLGRMGASEAQGQFKTVKKNFSFSDRKNNSAGLNNSNLLMKRGSSLDKQKQKSLLGFGYLLEQKKINQLKSHINNIAHEKNKTKNQIHATQDTQPDIHMMSRTTGLNPNRMRKRKIKGMSTKFYPELGQSVIREYLMDDQLAAIQQQETENGTNDSRSVPTYLLDQYQPKRIKISYKTSLNNLKDIFQSLQRRDSVNLEVTVPNILMNLRINPNLDKTALYNQTVEIFEGLGIPLHNPTVKRYSNCVLMVNKHIGVLVHYNSKVYLGGWQAEYLDEGVKHGLGLQWVPNRYVYYGQFASNKRQGLGVMKTNQQSFMGIWQRNKRTSDGVSISRNGEIETINSHRVGQTTAFRHEDNDEDPFL